MSKRKPRAKRERNDLARMKAMGIHAITEHQSIEQSIFELSRWGLGMKREDLASSAALISCKDASRWTCTLATRQYFMRLNKLTESGPNTELTAALTAPAAIDELLLLIINGDDAGHSTLQVTEMKEATNGRQIQHRSHIQGH